MAGGPGHDGSLRVRDPCGVEPVIALEVPVTEEPGRRDEGGEERRLGQVVRSRAVGLHGQQGGHAAVGRPERERATHESFVRGGLGRLLGQVALPGGVTAAVEGQRADPGRHE